MNREILERLYRTFNKPFGLSNTKTLYKEAKKYGISFEETKKYLQSEPSHSLHINKRRKFIRRKIIANGPRKILSSDLADVSKLSKDNKGIRFLMVTTDVFSRYTVVHPMKNKNSDTASQTLDKIFKDPLFKGVSHIMTDKGQEYVNKKSKAVYKKYGITQYGTYNSLKASISERCIQSFKRQIYRSMSLRNSKRYIDILPQIVERYNNSIHRSLGNTPANIHNTKDHEVIIKLFHKMYDTNKKYKNFRRKKLDIAVGDLVKITSARRDAPFNKGYFMQNTKENFRVIGIDKKLYPPLFHIEDLAGEPILGRFYYSELTKVRDDSKSKK